MTVAEVGVDCAALPGHACNAYCRGRVHAEVFWCDITRDGPELAHQLLGSFCAARGLRCLRVEPAREVQRRGTGAYEWREESGRFVAVVGIPEHHTPFLLVFEEEGEQ